MGGNKVTLNYPPSIYSEFNEQEKRTYHEYCFVYQRILIVVNRAIFFPGLNPNKRQYIRRKALEKMFTLLDGEEFNPNCLGNTSRKRDSKILEIFVMPFIKLACGNNSQECMNC